MVYNLEIDTHTRQEMVDITRQVEEIVEKSGVKSGVCILYVPHTTAAITVNENYDPTVKEDILTTLRRLVPENYPYRHTEGNADAHIKAAIVGSSRVLFIENGGLVFGTWQGIFFMEFDGPRRRRVYVKIMADAAG